MGYKWIKVAGLGRMRRRQWPASDTGCDRKRGCVRRRPRTAIALLKPSDSTKCHAVDKVKKGASLKKWRPIPVMKLFSRLS